jgi:hypothetical protein
LLRTFKKNHKIKISDGCDCKAATSKTAKATFSKTEPEVSNKEPKRDFCYTDLSRQRNVLERLLANAKMAANLYLTVFAS